MNKRSDQSGLGSYAPSRTIVQLYPVQDSQGFVVFFALASDGNAWRGGIHVETSKFVKILFGSILAVSIAGFAGNQGIGPEGSFVRQQRSFRLVLPVLALLILRLSYGIFH